MRGKYSLSWAVFLLFSSSALADSGMIRWTQREDSNPEIGNVIRIVNEKSKNRFKPDDFLLMDDQDLAFNHYQRWVQIHDHTPISGKSIRIWSTLDTHQTVQVEAAVQSPRSTRRRMTEEGASISAAQLRRRVSPDETLALIRPWIERNTEDPYLQGLSWNDEWKDDQVLRIVKVRGKRGYHHLQILLEKRQVIAYEHREFPQADRLGATESLSDDLTLPVQVYPVYEEVEGVGTPMSRIPAQLRYLRRQIPDTRGEDIYAPLKTRHYYDTQYDPTLGETESGRAQGYWAPSYLRRQAEKIQASLPLRENDPTRGILLQGRFATINIHPDAFKDFPISSFPKNSSYAFFPNWVETVVDGKKVNELVPGSAFAGKPLLSVEEAWSRPARRLPNHDPAEYIQDGFDEIQVYYAINTLFEALQRRGFKDPELSTRPFNAFLFNPDIAYRDNAFYTEDTINFTTYSAKAANAARDNSTIWHELGHGIMDRLMGSHIELADTGGLSEGMADFIAALVIQDVQQGVPFPGSDRFRIINKIGFNLTNEVHDDGEAYGGAMHDFLGAALEKEGASGLDKVTDVVLEAMRLSRDYPRLTAKDWFEHLIFADSLGRPGLREPSELRPFIVQALTRRNFTLDEAPTASFSLVNVKTREEVVAGQPGSRENPILVNLNKTDQAQFALTVRIQNGREPVFHFPVQVQVHYTTGALQGAIHWTGKDRPPVTYTLNSESDTVRLPLQVSGTCDEINRSDGTCVDYAYVQAFNSGETRPIAKKRFYLKIKNP